MISIALLSLVVLPVVPADQAPALWKDPRRTLRVSRDELDRSLREVELPVKENNEALLTLLKSRPHDWRVHALVRRAVEVQRDPALAKAALQVLTSRVPFDADSPGFQRRLAYVGGLAFEFYEGSKKGVLKVNSQLESEWLGLSQDCLEVRAEALDSVEPAYLILNTYLGLNEVASGRAFLQSCLRHFKKDAGLQVYAVRLYSSSIQETLRYPAGYKGPIKIDPEKSVRFEPTKVRAASIEAWKLAPSDPGVLAVVLSGLARVKDSRAKAAARAYLEAKDPEGDRMKLVRQRYAEYF